MNTQNPSGSHTSCIDVTCLLYFFRFFFLFFSLFFISFFFISSAPVYAEIKCFLIIIICEHIIECILSPYAYKRLTATNLNSISICILVLNCINIPFIGYIFVPITLTTTPLPYRAVVYYILRQYVISSLFALVSTIARCELVLPAKCIYNETKGWAERNINQILEILGNPLMKYSQKKETKTHPPHLSM